MKTKFLFLLVALVALNVTLAIGGSNFIPETGILNPMQPLETFSVDLTDHCQINQCNSPSQHVWYCNTDAECPYRMVCINYQCVCVC